MLGILASFLIEKINNFIPCCKYLDCIDYKQFWPKFDKGNDEFKKTTMS